MTNGDIGRLEKVQLRELWATEAQEFTPWLGQEENIKFLGDSIGIELEVEAQEQEVGPFRADILCKDTASSDWVLIENQLERTDHTHLGQLMTYSAGLDAVTIIWIAGQFTEEHRASFDWLNRITAEGMNFFGLEIELWRIGDSPIAPKFNVVSKPNDWTKTVQSTAGRGELSETRRLQLEYWTELRRLMEDNGSPVRCQTPKPQHTTGFSIGRSYFHLVARANTRDKEIGAYLCLHGPEKRAHYQLLRERHKQQVEEQMGMELTWRELPDAKESQIVTCLPADPTDRSDWGRQHSWLKDKVEALHRVFSPIVKELDASELEDGN